MIGEKYGKHGNSTNTKSDKEAGNFGIHYPLKTTELILFAYLCQQTDMDVPQAVKQGTKISLPLQKTCFVRSYMFIFTCRSLWIATQK